MLAIIARLHHAHVSLRDISKLVFLASLVIQSRYEFKCGNLRDPNTVFVPFSFRLHLPPLRKARLIIERNRLGQVIKARAPYVKTHHLKLR